MLIYLALSQLKDQDHQSNGLALMVPSISFCLRASSLTWTGPAFHKLYQSVQSPCTSCNEEDAIHSKPIDKTLFHSPAVSSPNPLIWILHLSWYIPLRTHAVSCFVSVRPCFEGSQPCLLLSNASFKALKLRRSWKLTTSNEKTSALELKGIFHSCRNAWD